MYSESPDSGPDYRSVREAVRYYRGRKWDSLVYPGMIIDLYPCWECDPSHRLTIGPRFGVSVMRF